MKLKLIALVLTILMVGPALVACGEDKGGDTDESKETTVNTTEDTADNEYAYIDEYVDELASQFNYDGTTFTILDNGQSFPEEYEITGVLEDDALYNRYRELEEKFGITIDMQKRTEEDGDFDTPGAVIADEVRRDVMANGNSFDLVCGSAVNCGQILINNGVVRSINDMPGLDLSQGWWIGDMNTQLGLGDSLFSLTGKANESHYTTPTLICFSKRIVEDFNITENLYELVENGEWTFDKMFEIASTVPVNNSANCEGTYRYYTYNTSSGLAFYTGAGYRVTQKDTDGTPYIESSLTAEQINFIDKLAGVFGDTTQNFDNDKYKTIDSTASIHEEDRILFTMGDLGHVSGMRGSDIDFGILPVPKKDEAQEEYYAFSNSTWLMAFYFPLTLQDEEMSGVITEAMAALSEKYLEPAYYDKALKGRSTYDIESRSMLDIIYSSEVLELADMYQWGEVTTIIDKAVLGDTDTLVSAYNGGAKMAARSIKSLMKTVNKQKS